jgi:hypothetical protein
MKRFMLHTLLLSLTVALWGCGGDGKDEPQPGNVNINVSQENITVPAAGGTYTITVTTTGKEWGAYADKDFIVIDTKNTTSQSGSLTITVAANPMTEERAGQVVVMSGPGR